MSVLGYSLLNQVINVSAALVPDQILTQLDVELHRALARTERKGVGTADGMDVALCCYNTDTRELSYAGARRPLLVFKADGTLEAVSGTRRSIGGVDDTPFETHRMRLNAGDTVVIHTDGVTDQFGGENGRKLSTRRFREFMAENHRLPPAQLEQRISQMLAEWRGGFSQTDDILVMGIQV
jgi:serine phosphatase RsbU (regulator of sigma subunit)